MAVIDLDDVWQQRRARKLCTRHKLKLSEQLFQLDAFDALLIDWLHQAPSMELQNFADLEKRLNRAVYGGALKETSRSKQYDKQLNVLPFLLDNICGEPSGSLPTEGGNAVLRVNELLRLYLHAVSTQPENNPGMPGHCFFRQEISGALTGWLAQPQQQESRVLMYTFLRDITAYATVQAAGLSFGVRVKKMLLVSAGESRVTAQAQRDAVAEAEKAPKKPKRRFVVVQQMKVQRLGATMANLKIDPLVSEMQKATRTLLVRLLVELKCEMVEVVPASDDKVPLLVASQLVHPSVQSVRRNKVLASGAAWSNDLCNPLGLCAISRETVFVDCALQDGRFSLPYAIGEISQMYVPIFAYKRFRWSDIIASAVIRASPQTPQGSSPGFKQRGSPRLLGVLRCVNKFSATSSRAGFAFEAEDAQCVASFASLIAELAGDAARFDKELVKIQRAVRYCAEKRAELEGPPPPSPRPTSPPPIQEGKLPSISSVRTGAVLPPILVR